MSRNSRIGAAPRRGRLSTCMRMLGAVAAVAVIALLAVGCGGSDSNGDNAATTGAGTAQKSFTIGWLTPNQSDEFFIQQAKDFRPEIENLGGRMIIGVYDSNPVKNVQIAQDWINAGKVDAITGAIYTNGFQPALDLAAQKRVPLVLISDAPEKPLQDAQTLLTADYEYWGEVGGRAIARCINERLGGKAEIAFLGGPDVPGPTTIGRETGLKRAIAAGAPDAKIVADQNGDNQQLQELPGDGDDPPGAPGRLRRPTRRVDHGRGGGAGLNVGGPRRTLGGPASWGAAWLPSTSTASRCGPSSSCRTASGPPNPRARAGTHVP